MEQNNDAGMAVVAIFATNDNQMKEIITVAALFLVFGSLQAQEALQFDTKDFDFGEIEEAGGPVDHRFEFVNKGMEPIQILGVKASCGCTTPNWSKEVIPPGESGFITARYNPMNRPGAFRKSLRVSTSKPEVTATLFIKGSVNPRPRTIEDDLPTKIGFLRMKYRSLNFGKITTEKTVSRSFDVYNEGDAPISFLPDETQAPNFMEVTFEPETLEPKGKGKIVVNYDPQKMGNLGFQTSKVSISTTETNFKVKDLNVIATIEEYFAPLSPEELAEAPKLAVSDKVHDFGKIEKDAVVTTEFTLTNEGKTSLNIRQTASNCGCTTTELPVMDLKPGASTTMKVTFDSKGRRGRQYKTVTIFSNDPANPTQVLSIRAEVPRAN